MVLYWIAARAGMIRSAGEVSLRPEAAPAPTRTPSIENQEMQND